MKPGFASFGLLCATCAVAAAVTATGAPPASTDEAFVRFWNARNPDDAAQVAQDVVKTGVSFADALARLRRGRTYPSQARLGVIHDRRRSVLGEFAYDLNIPETYDPARPYQLRFQLHGGVMMRETGERQGGTGRGGGRGGPLLGAEQIYVTPTAWRDAPWWSRAQLENLEGILDAVKRTYNVDENHVVVSGVSDGGTGAYYVAMRDTTPFASFLPLNGSLMVLANDALNIDGEVFPTNMRNKPMFVVNGGQDPLYPVRAVQPFVDHLIAGGVKAEFHPQPDAAHNTSWWPQVKDTFEAFVKAHPRDPLPPALTWEATDRQTPSRAHWLVIDRVAASSEPRVEPDLNVFSGAGPNRGRVLFFRQRPSGRVDLERDGNTVRLRTRGVAELTLLISPDAFDFSQPVVVVANGRRVVEQRVEPSVATLMKWSARDNDRAMLFGNELHVSIR